MTINDKTKGKKLQFDIKRETAKTSALSSGKIDKYEFITSDQSRIIQQEKCTYSPLGKEFENKQKQLKDKEKTNRCYYKSKQKSIGFNQ